VIWGKKKTGIFLQRGMDRKCGDLPGRLNPWIDGVKKIRREVCWVVFRSIARMGEAGCGIMQNEKPDIASLIRATLVLSAMFRV
jgi:hypothetical protein